jgi:hypothetical protein
MTGKFASESTIDQGSDEAAPHMTDASQIPSTSNLAALLDAFTNSVAHPHTATIGQFAGTVQALHGELSFLASQFHDVAPSQAEIIAFDTIFPDDDNIGLVELDPAFHGVKAAEELEHLCRMLSQ